jgi:hypothetical protein
MSERAVQPIYLFADSQLLFWRNGGSAFIERICDRATCPSPLAVYIGASNGDAPEFYALFEAAMQGIEVRNCHPIRAAFAAEDAALLAEADIVLLAGGDVEAGWTIIEKTKMAELLRQRYLAGATLIGVSAGAVQLGLYAAIELSDAAHRLVDTLKLVPFIVGAHDEDREWSSLAAVVQMLEGSARGLGIPKGGGVVFHPDHSIEAIRRPAYEFSTTAGKLVQSLLLPAEGH